VTTTFDSPSHAAARGRFDDEAGSHGVHPEDLGAPEPMFDLGERTLLASRSEYL
jgi:hypothetical protein